MMAAEIGPFTPIPHSLAQEVGLVCAAVYGLVWRYCQMKEGVCKASLDTLGSDINIDRATVMRSIKKLCELGYLIDQTPDRRNAPHTYTLLKSVAECNSMDDKGVVMRNSLEGETVAHNNSSIESVAEDNATVAHSKATVAESHLKKDSKKPIQDTKESKSGGKPPAPPGVTVFVEVTKRHVLNNTQIKEIDERVGRDPPALDRWRETVKAWQLAGHKINNISGMLDWFKKGIPVYAQKASQNGTHQNTNRKGIKALEETGESLRQNRTTDTSTREYVYPDGHREPIPPVPRVPRRGLLSS